MKINVNITVEYDDDSINRIIKSNEQYAMKTNTIAQKIGDVLTCEIEDLIMTYADALEVNINNYEIVDYKR